MIYLFSLLALILLLPILYFIPIGISVKGKLLIAGIAFGLTLLGLVASTQYSIWMIGIMLMVLLGLSSYVIEQRFSGLLVLSTGTEMDLEEEPVQIVHEHKGLKENLHNKEEIEAKEERLELREDTVNSVPVEDEIVPIELEDLYEIEADVAEEDFETDGSIKQDDPLQAIDIIEVNPTAEAESKKVDEDESEWFIENVGEYEDENEIEEGNESSDIDLSEIERLINEPDETIENEKEEVKDVSDEKHEPVEELDDLPGSEDEYELDDALVDELVEVEKPEISEVPEDIEENISEEGLHAHEFPKRSRIMREVMKTMIEQITLSKSMLSPHQMENMIKHYLHPSLHDQDYYTFARILMDHYISTEQYEDLQMFTDGIAKRFKEYPYIKMDIEQTNEFAWKKLNEIKLTE